MSDEKPVLPGGLRLIERPFGFEQRDKKASWSDDVTPQDILYDVQEVMRGKKVLSCLIILRTEEEGENKTRFRAAGATEHIESSFLRGLGRFMNWENQE